jgi:hypothetical protein
MIPLVYIIVGLGAVAAVLILRTSSDPQSYTPPEPYESEPDMPVFSRVSLADYTACGLAGIDRLPLAQYVEEVFGTEATIAIARAVVALCYCETGGRTTPPVVGDTTLTVGPAIGPLQVTRATAKDLGLVPRDESFEAYKLRASDERWCIRAGVLVFASKLLSAHGDIADAIRRYNGSGTRAEQYRDKALSFLASTFGDYWQMEG